LEIEGCERCEQKREHGFLSLEAFEHLVDGAIKDTLLVRSGRLPAHLPIDECENVQGLQEHYGNGKSSEHWRNRGRHSCCTLWDALLESSPGP